LNARKSPDDRLQSDLIRELVGAKGVALEGFDRECDRLRKQLGNDVGNTPALSGHEVRYPDHNGHYRFRSAEAFYNWGATLDGYETIRVVKVEHLGAAKLSARSVVKVKRYLTLEEANQRIDYLETELAVNKRSLTRSQSGSYYGKVGGGRPRKSSKENE
jgi:hypothetical protein